MLFPFGYLGYLVLNDQLLIFPISFALPSLPCLVLCLCEPRALSPRGSNEGYKISLELLVMIRIPSGACFTNGQSLLADDPCLQLVSK
ncbi:hypothetical protein VNO78_33727 [Psophocarpus tetragonolobus]|uniref:Uncharacterized protein n=1 Tax=Psophocarpus tetragonolobus TaxID=3891 RepID=A0AAN9RQW8_PSOTE